MAATIPASCHRRLRDAALVPVAGGGLGELAALSSSPRRLAQASVSPHTRSAYAGALRRLDAWLGGRELDDARLAAYLAELFEAGRAASSAAMAVAAARLRAKLAGQPDPAGPATGRVLAGFRRRSADRGRGQAPPCSAANLAAIFATVERPRRAFRGLEPAERAAVGKGGVRLRDQEPEASHELQVDGPAVLGTPGGGASDRDGGVVAKRRGREPQLRVGISGDGPPVRQSSCRHGRFPPPGYGQGRT